MSNLKKILALVLALVMSLSLVTVASAYKDDEDVSETYEEAITVLTALGVFEGENGNFYPQRSITRAETAAILYRIVTGDVNDEQAHIYSDYMKFSDTYQSMWYAGYIGYCSNAELIKGYGGNKFGPQDKVTGYQALAMILRAIGYGQKGEFQGTGWEVKVASTAKEIGILDNIKESTLKQPATREMVAEMLYQGILVDQVVYSANREGYVTPFGSKSIAEETFKLSGPKDALNDWGQPSKTWTFVDQAKKTQTIDIPYKAAASYTTAVAECDVYDDTGVTAVTTFTNGKVNKGTDTINKTATKATIGAQGRQTYVYSTEKFGDIIVYIDTFLAKVTDVTEVKYDAKGHIAKQATLTLSIYDSVNNNSGTTVVLTSDSNYSYKVGEMLLVNAVTDSAADHSTIATDGDKFVKILGAAESFVGAQTYIQWTNNQHTVNGKVYDDALHFHLDQAHLNHTWNFNWWLDQFGNLIGATAIDRTNYAVVKDMKWITGTPGHAEATLIYMDGSEATVTVSHMDGDGDEAILNRFWDTDFDNSTPVMAASGTGFAGNNEVRVSHDTAFNNLFNGFALYQVITLDDGTVNLQAFRGITDLFIGYDNSARLDINGSEIIDANNEVLAHVDSSTKFIVNNGDGTYSAYTGTANLPDFANGSVEVFWSTAGTFTQNVYIKSFVPQAAFGEHLFTTTKTVGHFVGNWDGENYYTMSVVVDGVERTIVTDEDTKNILVNNTGKLFHAYWDQIPTIWDLIPNYTYGYVTHVRLINETSDNAADGCNYLSKVTVDDIGDKAIYDRDSKHSYNLTSATEIIYSDNTYDYANLREAIADGCGVWVVDTTRDGIANNALTIYVGSKLSTIDDISVTGKDNVKDIDKDYNVTIDERYEDAKLVIGAKNEYAKYSVSVNGGAAKWFFGFEDAELTVKLGDEIIVNVWNETYKVDDVADATYTINVNNYYQIGDAITKVMSSGESVTVGGFTTPLAVYNNFEDAVENARTFDVDTIEEIALFADNTKVVVNQTSTSDYKQFAAKSHTFTTTASITQGTFDANARILDFILTGNVGKSAGINISGWGENTTYVVSFCVRNVESGSAINEVAYFAFRVAE